VKRPVCFPPFPTVEFQIITELPTGAHLTIFRARVTIRRQGKAGPVFLKGKSFTGFLTLYDLLAHRAAISPLAH
jgi:hypothetical protein